LVHLLTKDKNSTYFLPLVLIYGLFCFESWSISLNLLNTMLYSGEQKYVFPQTLEFFSFFNQNTLKLFFIFGFSFVPVLTFLYFDLRFLRILSFFLLLFGKGLIFTAFRFNHQYWVLLLVLLFFSAPKSWLDDSAENIKWRNLSYRCAALAAVAFYFYPGFWKIFFYGKNGFLFDMNLASNTVAYYLISHHKSSMFAQVFVENYRISYWLFLGVICFQLAAPAVIFMEKFRFLWIALLICFHVASLLLLQVNFLTAGFVTILVLLFFPKNLELNWPLKTI
jgi:hypothetical protein